MKPIIVQLWLSIFIFSVVPTYSQQPAVPSRVSDSAAEILKSCYGNLQSAMVFNSVADGFKIIGGGLFAAGLAADNGGVTAVGFLAGFGGLEMSKYCPIPLTKAKRKLALLRSSWGDTSDFKRVYHQVSAAEALGYATVGLTFGGQFLLLLGALTEGDNTLGSALLVSGVACIAASLGTSIGATVMSGKALKSLGNRNGTLGFNAGPNGIGFVYRFHQMTGRRSP